MKKKTQPNKNQPWDYRKVYGQWSIKLCQDTKPFAQVEGKTSNNQITRSISEI